MRHSRIIFGLIIAMFLLSFGTVGAEEQPIVLATTQWPPYTGHDLKAEGYASEIVTQAFQRAGYKVIIKYYPWPDALEAARTGQLDGLFPIYHETARESDFLFPDALAKSPLGLFKRTALPGKTPLGMTKSLSDIKYPVDPRVDREAALMGLKDYSFGIVTGYANPPVFETEGFNVVKAVNDRENMENLMEDRVDLAVMDRRVGRFLIREYHLWRKDQVAFMAPPLAMRSLFVAISRKTAEPSVKVQAFNRGLDALKADGVLERIREAHRIGSD